LTHKQKTTSYQYDSNGFAYQQVNIEDVMSYEMSQNHIWAVLWNGNAWQVYQGYIPGDITMQGGAYVYSMGYDLQGWLTSGSPFATTDGFNASVMQTYLGHLRKFVTNGDPKNPKPFDCANHAALFLEREDTMQGKHYVPQFDFTEFHDDHVNTADALKSLMAVSCPFDYKNTTSHPKPQKVYLPKTGLPSKPKLSTLFGLLGASQRHANQQKQYVQISGMNWHLKMADDQLFSCKNATPVTTTTGQIVQWRVDVNSFYAYGKNLWQIPS
jgi:hypothetical protein